MGFVPLQAACGHSRVSSANCVLWEGRSEPFGFGVGAGGYGSFCRLDFYAHTYADMYVHFIHHLQV